MRLEAGCSSLTDDGDGDLGRRLVLVEGIAAHDISVTGPRRDGERRDGTTPIFILPTGTKASNG